MVQSLLSRVALPHGRNKEALLKCKNDAEIEVLNCNFDDED